jgi:hypothetical protein
MDYTKDAVLIGEIIKKHSHNHTVTTVLDTHIDDFVDDSSTITTLNQTSPTLYEECTEDSINDTLCYLPYSMRPETYIVPILFAVIFLIGVLGNGTLIMIFLKQKSMRNVPNM